MSIKLNILKNMPHIHAQTISPKNYYVPNFEFAVKTFELNSFKHEYAAHFSECFT